MTYPYLESVLAFSVFVYALHTLLDVRQLKAIKLPKPPAELASAFSDDMFKKTQLYSLDKWWFGLYHGVFSLFESLALLYFGFLPWLWRETGQHLLAVAGTWGYSEIVHTIAFVLVFSFISMVVELPWSLYKTFVLEEKHGFNKQTMSLFFQDMVKTMAIGAVLVPPIVAGITYILQVAGPWVAIYLWIFTLVLSIVMMTIYPELIAPLFNKYDPLEEGTLRSKIEALASSLKFPLKRLYRVDGSKRSAHSNAYMYGFFNNKRIVLYDTLIQQCSEEQVVGVLAHELGHWKLWHTPSLFIAQNLVTLISFSLFTIIRAAPGLYTSFGFPASEKPVFVALLLFQFISAPVDEVVSFLFNAVSRTFEFQADSFATGLGYSADLVSALLKLEEENKSALNVDPWYSAYHYSHPPLVERIKAIKAKAGEAVKKGQ